MFAEKVTFYFFSLEANTNIEKLRIDHHIF